jgi:two-component system, chemotaxis family, protein-glutamate methylesterase/glutaminase
MPVELITERMVIEPNHVFIIPAQSDLHVLDGEFHLLRSLTEHWDGKLIAVRTCPKAP